MANRLKPGAEDVLRKFAQEITTGNGAGARRIPELGRRLEHLSIEANRTIRALPCTLFLLNFMGLLDRPRETCHYSHSIVPGGLLVTS